MKTLGSYPIDQMPAPVELKVQTWQTELEYLQQEARRAPVGKRLKYNVLLEFLDEEFQILVSELAKAECNERTSRSSCNEKLAAFEKVLSAVKSQFR